MGSLASGGKGDATIGWLTGYVQGFDKGHGGEAKASLQDELGLMFEGFRKVQWAQGHTSPAHTARASLKGSRLFGSQHLPLQSQGSECWSLPYQRLPDP